MEELAEVKTENGNIHENKPKKKLTDAKKKEILFIASLLGIPIIFFLVFWLYVNLDSLAMSFQREKYDLTGMHLYFTFENFEMVFTGFFRDGDLLIALRNTLLFYAVALLIVLPISILMAYFVYKKILGYKVFRTVTYLPTIICSSALVILYKYTFMSGGPYAAILHALGKTYEYPLVTDNAIIMLLIYNVIFGFGGNMVVLGGAMNAISEDVLEAGEIDGCNWFQELIHLVIPMVWPTISTIIVLSFAGILSSTGPILAMTQGEYNTQTLSFLLYGYATGAVPTISQDMYYASAIGLVMTAITFPIVLVLRKVLYREGKE